MEQQSGLQAKVASSRFTRPRVCKAEIAQRGCKRVGRIHAELGRGGAGFCCPHSFPLVAPRGRPRAKARSPRGQAGGALRTSLPPAQASVSSSGQWVGIPAVGRTALEGPPKPAPPRSLPQSLGTSRSRSLPLPPGPGREGAVRRRGGEPARLRGDLGAAGPPGSAAEFLQGRGTRAGDGVRAPWARQPRREVRLRA